MLLNDFLFDFVLVVNLFGFIQSIVEPLLLFRNKSIIGHILRFLYEQKSSCFSFVGIRRLCSRNSQKSSQIDEYECEHERSYLVCYALFVIAYFKKVEQNDSDVIMRLMHLELVEDFLCNTNKTYF